MEHTTFTRQEFYKLIWATPLSRLSQTYAISDNGLRKMCRKYNIPIPANGYWSKVKFNKPVKPEKLPTFQMDKDEIRLPLREAGSTLNVDASPETLLTREIRSDANAPTRVPDELVKPHLLIRETKRHWAEDKKHRYDYTFKNTIPCLSIAVGKASEPRAMRFFDTLIKLLEYRGHAVITRGYTTLAVIEGIEIKMALREASNRVYDTTGSWRTSELVPNGKLVLKTGEYSREKEWRDNATTIESMLPKIAARLEMDAKRELEWQENARLAAIRREEEERIRREQEALRRAEQQREEALFLQAEHYHKAQKIRLFIEAAHQKALAAGPVSEDFAAWMAWANGKADTLDPLFAGDVPAVGTE